MKIPLKITATIITFNEAARIADAIKSVSWADEVLVVDSESTDDTREIAKSLGAKVIVNKWPGFPAQKNFAAQNAEHDWIFSLDADEVVSENLKDEILALKNGDGSTLAGGYRIPRLSYYMGRPIRHGGWYPDWQLRFYNRNSGKWKEVLVHESVELAAEARMEKLSGDILHYSVEDASNHHKMIGERYAPLSAKQMYENGRRTSPLKAMTAGFSAFIQAYILKGGFLDGFPGFCIARFASHHAFMKHLLLWEIQNRNAD